MILLIKLDNGYFNCKFKLNTSNYLQVTYDLAIFLSRKTKKENTSVTFS